MSIPLSATDAIPFSALTRSSVAPSAPRVLIVGYGKMGRIHASHLDDLNVEWTYFDPYVSGGIDRLDFEGCTHAVVASPIVTHYDVFCALARFPGPILIEKPVVIQPEHLHVFDDPRVFAGMCERFNPAFQRIQRRLSDARRLEFVRTGPSAHLDDVAIHDLDLCCLSFMWTGVPEWTWEGPTLHARGADGQEATFRWQTAPRPERKIRADCVSGVCVVDLLNQTVDGCSVGHQWPVLHELKSFLSGERLNARVAHQWLAELLGAASAKVPARIQEECEKRTPA